MNTGLPHDHPPQSKSAVADFDHLIEWPKPAYTRFRQGEGRIAEADPECGGGEAVDDGEATLVDGPSPPPGPLSPALPPAGGGGPLGLGAERNALPLPAGRMCPLDYRYDPAVFARRADFSADVLYVAGGLYGNLWAAQAIEQLAAAERSNVTIVYNGDFHWFDAEDDWLDAIERAVAPHLALRGNVETEIVRTSDIGAGCGCAYPSDVADDVVMRSNQILSELRGVASRALATRTRLSGLPMHLVAEVGGLRIGIVHGDATSLAGWNFTREVLAAALPASLADLQTRSHIDVFASTHTCLALLHHVALPNGRLTVINNGAAGMPNFAGTRHGLISRIAAMPSPHRPVYGLKRGRVHIDALAVDYDPGRFLDRFLARWPEGSPAHLSYARRIFEGPAHTIAQALGSAVK